MSSPHSLIICFFLLISSSKVPHVLSLFRLHFHYPRIPAPMLLSLSSVPAICNKRFFINGIPCRHQNKGLCDCRCHNCIIPLWKGGHKTRRNHCQNFIYHPLYTNIEPKIKYSFCAYDTSFTVTFPSQKIITEIVCFFNIYAALKRVVIPHILMMSLFIYIFSKRSSISRIFFCSLSDISFSINSCFILAINRISENR